MNAIARIAKSRIARNTSALMAAQVAARALGVVYVAALAKYVGPEGIGRISTATALNGLLVLVVGPGLNTLLIRDVAADTRKADAYVGNMLFLKALLGIPFILLTVAVVHAVGYPPDTARIVYTYSLVYFIDTVGEILAAVFRAFERMEYEAAGQILRDLVNISLSLVAIHLRWPLLAIVFASVIAQLCKLVFMAVLAYGRFLRRRLAISLRACKQLFITSLPFGVLLIFLVARLQVGTFVLSIYHPEEVVGIYSAANTLIGMILLMPGAFSSALFPVLSSLHVHAQDELRRFYQLCHKLLLMVAFPLGLGTMLVGDRVIALVYGDQFQASAAIIRVIGVYLLTLAGYVNGPLLNAIGKQRFFAWTQGVAVAANALLCFLLVRRWGPMAVAATFVLVGMASYSVHSIACHRLLGLPLPWLTVGKVLLATLAMGSGVYVSLRAGLPWLVVVLVVAPIIYGAASLALGTLKREELRALSSRSGPGWAHRETRPA